MAKRKLFLVLTVLLSLMSSASSTVVIVNAQTETPSELSREQVLNIFMLREKFWGDGTKITVLLLPKKSVITRDFASSILGVPVKTYYTLIEFLVEKQKHEGPELMPNEYSLIVKLRNTPGGIGYIFSPDILNNSPHFKQIIVLP